jgi:hypothetical protein
MRKIYIIALTIIFAALIAIPAFALSWNAERFIKACHALDAPFPPQGWDKLDLQAASLEVLDEIEQGNLNDELINFCLIAIGSVGDPDDLPRIMAYRDDFKMTVLRALKGFSAPDAINYLLASTDSKEIPVRELAVLSLEKMDFKKLDKPMDWYDKVRNKLIAVRDKEKEDWFKADIQKAIDKLEKPPVETK